MKLAEAMEILEAACNHEERFDEEELWDAQQLGIEASKRLLELRRDNPETVWQLLPGETE